jgi:hypothetical protein
VTFPFRCWSDRAPTTGLLSFVPGLGRTLSSALVPVLVVALPCRAQELPLSESFMPAGVSEYAAEVPRPEDVLGYRIGERHTRPEEVVRYFKAVAAASDRVQFEVHGATHEGRQLVHAVVTSAANMARLEEIRVQNLRLFDSPNAVSASQLEAMPAVVYLAYSVHGNEASGSEASLLALYHLAAGQGSAVNPVLEDLIVIIDPMLNPDGRDRFVDWVNGNRGAAFTTDPQDREHNEPWPGGRTNHYWFDLNRDWLPLTQPESRARLALFGSWRPQLLCDFHEMGGNATFFFQPGVAERTNPNTPERNQQLTSRIGEYHARAFDRIGQPYYSGESFDDFFYGKGSTYPDLNGAVGILFEQASSRSRAVETSAGILPYARSIRNQFVATLSSLEAAVSLRVELLSNQREFYGDVDRWADDLSYDAWVIDQTADGTRSATLATLLYLHGIRAYDNSVSVETNGVRYEPGDALIAPLRQPQGRLLKAMMERVTEFRDSVFYDVSTWTLPLAYDVAAAPVDGISRAALGVEFLPAEGLGSEAVGPGPSNVGWLLSWGSAAAARSLVRWIDEGFEARLITHPFTADVEGSEREFSAGTVLLAPRRDRQLVSHADLAPLLSDLALEEGAELATLSSALTMAGPDLGGPSARLVTRPEIAILTGRGLSGNRAGELWHLLSLETGLPVTLLDVDRMPTDGLDRYDVMIVAGGSVVESANEPISEWVQSGGTLLVIGSGNSWATEAGLLELEERPFDTDSLLSGTDWSNLGAARSAQSISGAILEARLDPTHPLSFGIGDRLPLFVTGGTFFDPAPTPGSTVGVYSDSPRLSGWLSAARQPQVSGAAAVSVERKGRGRVIGIHAYPAFRGYWRGGYRLVWNSVLFGPAL